MSMDTDKKTGYELITIIIFYFHISLKISFQRSRTGGVFRSANMRRWRSSRLLQPASVNRQFGRGGSQTLTLGLQVGSFGALCWRRPEFHPGVFAQHVVEPERVGHQVKASSFYLLLFFYFLSWRSNPVWALVLPAGAAVQGPQVHFGPHEQVLGTQLQADSVSAAGMRQEEPSVSR